MIQSADEITPEIFHPETGIHQHLAAVNLIGSLQTIFFRRIKAAQANLAGRHICLCQHLYVGHKHFAFILRCYCPAVGSVVFTAGKNTVILSLADQFMIFVIHCGLLRNQLSLFFRQFCDIKLIAVTFRPVPHGLSL